jgi:hypothetical protein
MNRIDDGRFTLSKCRSSYPDQFQSDFTNDLSKYRSRIQRLRTGALSGSLSDVMLFGTDKFPEHGRDFHLNSLIEEMDHAFEGPDEF